MTASPEVDFSVIIPTRNRPQSLSGCLGALSRLRAAPRFEVIVVDDGGSCDLESVVEPWREKIQLSLLPIPHSGPAAARNAGARAARGRWLAFTDDDCSPAPEWLGAFAAVLGSTRHLLVGGRTENQLGHNLYADVSQLIQHLAYEYFQHGSRGLSFFASNNMALPAEDFWELDGFDASFRTAEDRDLCDRWVLSGRRMAYVPEALVYHSHSMGLAEFCRQHFGYGRGARRFHLAHRRRGAGTSTIQPRFYGWLLARLPSLLRTHPRPARLLLLLGLWQFSNTAGYLVEVLRPGGCHVPE